MRSLPEIRCRTTASSSNVQAETPDVQLGRESGIGSVVLKVLMIQFSAKKGCMVSGADRDPSYLCHFADPPSDGPRLHNPGMTLKHIQKVPCYADQIVTRRTFFQPPKPLFPMEMLINSFPA
jgi:hypothetical protein